MRPTVGSFLCSYGGQKALRSAVCKLKKHRAPTQSGPRGLRPGEAVSVGPRVQRPWRSEER